MKTTAEFENGSCRVRLVPESTWESQLLGALANGGVKLDAAVEYKPEGHYSYGRCAVIQVELTAPKQSEQK